MAFETCISALWQTKSPFPMETETVTMLDYKGKCLHKCIMELEGSKESWEAENVMVGSPGKLARSWDLALRSPMEPWMMLSMFDSRYGNEKAEGPAETRAEWETACETQGGWSYAFRMSEKYTCSPGEDRQDACVSNSMLHGGASSLILLEVVHPNPHAAYDENLQVENLTRSYTLRQCSKGTGDNKCQFSYDKILRGGGCHRRVTKPPGKQGIQSESHQK